MEPNDQQTDDLPSSRWPRVLLRLARVQVDQVLAGERAAVDAPVLESLQELASGSVEDPNGRRVAVDAKTRQLVAGLLVQIHGGSTFIRSQVWDGVVEPKRSRR